MQAEDMHSSFVFVGDLNGHHQEWLGSTATNRHSVAACDLASESSCNQSVVGPTHARGGTHDLIFLSLCPMISCLALRSPRIYTGSVLLRIL